MPQYKHILVKPIAGAIGADIENVHISKPLSNDELLMQAGRQAIVRDHTR